MSDERETGKYTLFGWEVGFGKFLHLRGHAALCPCYARFVAIYAERAKVSIIKDSELMTKYKIQNALGRGAFGSVYRATNEAGVAFALKYFDPSSAVLAAIAQGYISSEELKSRFFNEAEYQSLINHPNIVKVFEKNLLVTPPFFVMELAEASLTNDMESDHTLGGNPQQALFDILSGLEELHSKGIYHRDLKPQNILRIRSHDGSYRYALSDLGLIKVTTSDATTLTATGTQGGTERYAAPELITDFKKATVRSDIFSFGVILFDIFVGSFSRVPYTEVNFQGAVGRVASKCTKTAPARRYGSIAEVRTALYEALRVETPQFGSRDEEQIVELLQSENTLTNREWDHVFFLLEELPPTSRSFDLLLRMFSKHHLETLKNEAPELLMAFANYYTDYVDEGQGKFDFDYCDVIADKLTWLFELGDVAVKARTLLTMLCLGTSHNRWFVERRFMQLAGINLNAAVAQRIILDVEVKRFDFKSKIDNLSYSIGMPHTQLSPALHRLCV